MRLPTLVTLLLAGVCFAPSARCDGTAPPPSAADEVAAKLPPDVADAAHKWLHADRKELKAELAFSPEDLEREVIVLLASEPEAADFVLSRLAGEKPKTVTLVLRVIAFDPFWTGVPNLVATLKADAAAATSADVVEAYLDTIRALETKEIRAVIASKLAAARAAGDSKTVEALAASDERWLMIQRGAPIPGYMRRAPAVFSVAAAEKPIRVIGMGDFGSGTQSQRDVAAAIVAMGKAAPFDFGITFGDNFYPSGMTSTDDPRWHDWWEALYGPLGVAFYPSFGNHEWYSDDGAVSELAYRSPTWRFPAPYYTYTAGSVQFFVVDTTEISEAQVLWLDREISASKAHWKVVYGHHPIFAPEATAKAGAYMKTMQARLWPVIRGRVDAYLCGHQHAMAHMDPVDGVHFFMSGGGGAPLGKVAKNAPGALFAESRFGFLTLEADASRLTLTLFDSNGKPFDSETVTK